MCFVEYNWTANVWQFRIGDRFTDFQGTRSWPDLSEVKSFFKAKNCALRKTDSRTYAVEARDTRRWGLERK